MVWAALDTSGVECLVITDRAMNLICIRAPAHVLELKTA